MPTKRRILELLTRPELRAIADRYDLKVEDRRIKDHLVEAAASSRAVSLAEILGEYARDRLKELCRALHLDDGGRDKASLVERLLGSSAAGAAAKTSPLPPSTLPAARGAARPYPSGLTRMAS